MKNLFALALVPTLCFGGKLIETSIKIKNDFAKTVDYRVDGGKTPKSCIQLNILSGKINTGDEKTLTLPKEINNVNFLCISINTDGGSDDLIFKTAFQENCRIKIIDPKTIELSPECKNGLEQK